MRLRININPHELQRQVQLAFLLEATIPKRGCTSRFQDIGPKQRFEDFAVSAVNSGRYFFELAQRINARQGQPECFYDLAHAAMLSSQESRTGKIVNYGLLETMFPVAVARCLCGGGGNTTLGLVPEVLKKTSGQDVHFVAEMRREIYSRSDKPFKRDFPFHEEGANVYEHYAHHRQVGTDISRLFVGELMEGMPTAIFIYNVLGGKGRPVTADYLNSVFEMAKYRTGLPSGALADFTAVAFYLLIADNPAEAIV